MPNISIDNVDMQKMIIEKYEDRSSGETKFKISQYYHYLDSDGNRVSQLGRGQEVEESKIDNVPRGLLKSFENIQKHMKDKAQKREGV